MRVPTSWSEVTLKQYQDFVDVSQVDMNEIDKHAKIIAIMTGESEDFILDLNLATIKNIIRELSFLYTKPQPGKVKPFLKINGKYYRVETNVRNLSAGEYIDLISYQKNPKDLVANLPSILSIYLHPVNMLGMRKKSRHKWNSEELKYIQLLSSRIETAKIIPDHITMDEVYALTGFFLRSWDALIAAILSYSESQLNKQMKKTKKQLQEVGLEIIGGGI